MHIGFDYGTSNCAVALMQQGQVRILPLEADARYLPSTLYAPHRDVIADLLLAQLPAAQQDDYRRARQNMLAKA